MLANFEHMKQQREEGFTLVEMVVAVAIVALLVAIAVPAFLNQKKAGVDAQVQGEVKSAALVVKTWAVSNPRAVPDASVISTVKKSPETTLSITSSGPGRFVITGVNPKGDVAKTGYSFDSQTDSY